MEDNKDTTPIAEPAKIYNSLNNVGSVAASIGGTDFGSSKYDASNTSYEDILNGNYKNLRGDKQGAGDKFVNGVSRATGRAAQTFINGTAGNVYGLANYLTDAIDPDKDATVNTIFDNDLTRGVNKVLEDVESNIPMYRTKDEDNYSFLKRLGTANFIFGDILSGAGTTLGAIGTGGLASAAFKGGAKLLVSKGAKGAAQAIAEGEDALQILSDANKIKLNAANQIVASTLSASSEAGQEAMDAGDEFVTKTISERTAEYAKAGLEIPQSEIDHIKSLGEKLKTSVFGLNLPIIAGSNFLQFGKTMTNFGAEKRAVDGVLSSVSEKITQNQALGEFSKIPLTTFEKTIGKAGKILAQPIEEGTQEQLQQAIGVGAQDFYSKRFKGKDTTFGDAVSSALTGLEDAYGTQKGWEAFMSGALSTLLTGSVSKDSQLRQAFKSQDPIIKNSLEVLNKTTSSAVFKELLQSANRATEISEDMSVAAANNNKFEFNNAQSDMLTNWVLSRIKTDKYDSLIDDLDAFKTASPEELNKLLGVNVTESNKNSVLEFVQDRISKSKEIKNSYETIENYFPTLSEGNKERLLHSAVTISDTKNRIAELNKQFNDILIKDKSDLSFGVKIQNVTDPETFIKELQELNINPIQKPVLSDLYNDINKLKIRQKEYTDLYNNLLNPEVQKENDIVDKVTQPKPVVEQLADEELDQVNDALNQFSQDKADKGTIESKPAPIEVVKGKKVSYNGSEWELDKIIIDSKGNQQVTIKRENKKVTMPISQYEELLKPKVEIILDPETGDEIIDPFSSYAASNNTDELGEIFNEEENTADDTELVGKTLTGPELPSSNNEELISPDDRIGQATPGIIMMKLYQNIFKTLENGFKRFIWSRDTKGNVIPENKSKLDAGFINSPKSLTVDTAIRYELESLSSEQTADDASIAIFSGDKKIGYYPLPKEIPFDKQDKVQYHDALEANKAERTAIFDKLKAGEQVNSTILVKGTGNLLTKLTPEGKVDATKNVFETLRDTDKLEGKIIFVYNNGEGLVFNNQDSFDDKQATDQISVDLQSFGKWGRSGQVFMLVKTANNTYSPVPVYSTKVTPKTATSVLSIINKSSSEITPKELISKLNNYVFASLSDRTSSGLYVDTKEGVLFIRDVKGKTYTLEQLKTDKEAQKQFKDNLLLLKHNIDIKTINESKTQDTLNKNNMLATNIESDDSRNFFVQPYITVKSIITPTLDVKDEVEVEDNQQKADIERRREEELKQFGTSEKETTKYNIKVLIDPEAKVKGEKQSFVSRDLMELAFKNDLSNAGIQTLDTIIRRGGYSSKELSKLLKPEIDKINAKYDAEYVNAVKKGEMTKEQAMQALEEIGRKESSAYAELAALEGKPLNINERRKDAIEKATTQNSHWSTPLILNKEGVKKTWWTKKEMISAINSGEYDKELTNFKNKAPLSKITSKLSNLSQEDIDAAEALNSIDSSIFNPSIKEDHSKLQKWLDKKLPGLTLADAKMMQKVKGMDGAWGMYMNKIIYLAQGAAYGTGFHEAFHGVFRTMLTANERSLLIQEVAKTSTIPTEAQEAQIRSLYKQELTDDQMMWLWYEERLADKFAEYTQNYVPLKGLPRIMEFFKSILQAFGFIKQNQYNMNELFNKINKGEYKGKSKLAKAEMADIGPLKRIEGFKANTKQDKVRSLAGMFSKEFYSQYASGVPVNKIDTKKIYKSIIDKIETLIANEENGIKVAGLAKLLYTNPKVDSELNPSNYTNFDKFIPEINKVLAEQGIVIKDKEIAIDQSKLNEEADIEETSLQGNTTKGYSELNSINPITFTSTRLKLFYSSIQSMEDGVAKTDELGLPIYHDWKKVYYYLQKNLAGLLTYEEMMGRLRDLSVVRPEVQEILRFLEFGDESIKSAEELEQLRNDFKTDNSKQQMAQKLVLADRNNSTGEVSFKILEANRSTINNEIFREWSDNLSTPDRNTISERDKEGVLTPFGTDKSKELLSQWEALRNKWLTTDKKPGFKILNSLLNSAGIEYSKQVLSNLIDTKNGDFIASLNTVLEWYASDNGKTNEGRGKKALRNLVALETQGNINYYSTNSTDVENKPIWTLQLPSFASKLFSRINRYSESAWNKWSKENFTKDPIYKYSNLFDLMQSNKFRKEIFRLSYLQGLKDARGESKGSKFGTMDSSDYMATQMALFLNTNVNQDKVLGDRVHSYVYLTPADKQNIITVDSTAFGVNLRNGIITDDSEIVDKFYNLILGEAGRIKQQLLIKKKVLDPKNKEYSLKDLNEYYHYKGGDPSDKFNGFAYQFNLIPTLNDSILDKLIPLLSENFKSKVEEDLASFEPVIKDIIAKYLTNEYKSTVTEALEEGLIKTEKDETGKITGFKNVKIDTEAFKEGKSIQQLLANFSSNTLLHNIELSQMLNGDVAQYKANDLQKRTYQSSAQTKQGNLSPNDKVRIYVVEDEYLKADPDLENWSEKAVEDYKKSIITDAQVWAMPEFTKKLESSVGTWTPEKQRASDIAEGITTPDKIDPALQQVLAPIKPFYFNQRFDDKMGMVKYEQIKMSIQSLYKNYLENNPLMSKYRAQLDGKADMIVPKSALKALMPHLNSWEHIDLNTIIELPLEGLGIQVDNPNHLLDEENDGIRQVTMLIPGVISVDKDYNGRSGQEIKDEILALESANINESLKDLKYDITAKDSKFNQELADAILRRGTDNSEEALEIMPDGTFKVGLDTGPTSREGEYIISSIYTKNVVKQAFKGGSAVQAGALGFKYKNLKEQQESVDSKPELKDLQTDLNYVIKNGKFEYIEAAMPSWAREFFDENGFIKSDIPDNLKTLFAYRIPSEGLHSMLPLRVVKFLPETYGNYILLPYHVTTQLGADFDFDKIYFLAPEFKKDKEGNLSKVEYDNTIAPGENSREARNNKILDNYISILTSKEAFKHIIAKSSFDKLTELKLKITQEEKEAGKFEHPDFFSGKSQRALRKRNNVAKMLKGIMALHVTGHSYGALMNLHTDPKFKIKINGVTSTNYSSQYSLDGETLISDEVATMLAAILDDIKDPLLERLGINQFTANIWATIVRAGFSVETATNFTTHPVVKELSALQSKNNQKIKDIGQRYNSVETLLKSYEQKYDALYNSVSDSAKEQLDAIKKKGGISDKELVEDRKNALSKTSKTEIDIATEYLHNIKVLKQYNKYNKIAKNLTDINKFFTINKEVGPTFESMIEKEYLYDKLTNEEALIKGFNIHDIPTLSSLYNTLKNAIAYMEQHYPYNSKLYSDIKTMTGNIQKGEGILAYKTEDRDRINQFISYYLSAKQDFFKNTPTKESKERLFKVLPSIIRDIKNPGSDDKYQNGKTRKNTFIDNIAVTYPENANGLGFITLKAGKIDQTLKNSMIEGFIELYNNAETKLIAESLIKHSFISGGFFTGLKAYHSLIPVDILQQVGFTDYRKKLVSDAKNEKLLVSLQEKGRIMDQLIRNFPKKYTKVFDTNMFGKFKEGTVPNKIVTNEALISNSKRTKDMIVDEIIPGGEDKKVPIYTKYIRVFIPKVGSVLYKAEDTFKPVYARIDELGKNGYMIEVNPNEDIETSIFKEKPKKEQPVIEAAGNIEAPMINSSQEEGYQDSFGESVGEDIDDIEDFEIFDDEDDDSASFFGEAINQKPSESKGINDATQDYINKC